MKTCRYLRGRQAEFCSKSKAASVNAFAAFLSPSLWITCNGGSPKVLIKIKSSSNLSSLGSSISCRLGLGCHHSLHFPGEANVLDLNSDRERKCAFLSYLSTWGHGFPICRSPAPDRRLAALRSAPWVSMLKNLCELKLTSRKAFRRGCSFPGRSFCECVRLHHDMITSDDLLVIHEHFGVAPEHGAGKRERGVPVVLVVAHRCQRVRHLRAIVSQNMKGFILWFMNRCKRVILGSFLVFKQSILGRGQWRPPSQWRNP